ncbi:MAG: ornithine cyclodeaminase family protein [Anaerolineae bacterium]
MNVLVLNGDEVASLLPMTDAIEVMSDALQTLARGDAILPLRPIMWLPDRIGALGMMPAFVGGEMSVMGLKVVSVFPGNRDTPYDSHQGAVMLFETNHGRPLAIIDASAITAIRTAAVTGVATRALAREDAGDLAILGSGVQAETHLAAMLSVRPIRRVRVWSRTPDNAQEFAARKGECHNVEIEVTGSAQAAVDGADLICTVTSAAEPVLKGDWIAEGAHVNAVGSSVPFARELDTQAVARSRMYVDRRESALNEAGDFLFPKHEGAVDDSHIQGELGDLLIGRVEGRRSPADITLFKSLGLAVEDLAAGYHVYLKALANNVGTAVNLGGARG